MGTVHDLLALKGKAEALRETGDDKRQRQALLAAAGFQTDENLESNFLFSGWALAGLPHRRIEPEREWRVETDHIILLVEPGRKPLPNGTNPFVGVPYGSRARLIMLYLQTSATRTRSREIELGRSMNDWMGRLGVPVGGKSFTDVREQAERISRCRLTFTLSRQGRTALVNQNILDTAMFVHDDARQSSLSLDVARLSEGFFNQLMKHPVPVAEAAIRQLTNNSMALDIYCWLAYRLHVLTKPTPIAWPSIHQQFGTGFRQMKHFKPTFLDNLALAIGVYPEAKLEEREGGLVLLPSKPAVPRTMLALPVTAKAGR